MKKFHFILVTFICLLCSMNFTHIASASEITIQGFHITYEDDVLTCSGQGKLESSVISSLPKYHEYKNSTKKIIIEDGITGIGYDAFRNFVKVESVQFPDVMNSIGYDSFNGCKSLTSIVLPDELKELGGYAFAHCNNLSKVTFGQYHSPINYYALYFRECAFAYTPLSTAIVPKYTLAGEEYPIQCDGYALYSSYGRILWKYLDGNTNTEYTMPDKVRSIEGKAFLEAKHLKKITLSNNLFSIGVNCFENCEQLNSLTIPASVKEINNTSGTIFKSCANIETIVNHSNLTINLSSWNCCPSQNYCSDYINHQSTSSTRTEHHLYKDSETNAPPLTLESGHTIKQFKFWLPDDTSFLETLSPPEGGIAPTAVPTATPNNEVNDNFTFSYNDNILTCSGKGVLTKSDIPENLPWEEYKKNAKKIVISDGITGIGPEVFARFISVESIEFPQKMHDIGYLAFGYCSAIKSITLPDCLATLGQAAFYKCSHLEKVTFGQSLDFGFHLEYEAFQGTNLKEVIVPECGVTGKPHPIFFDGNAIYEYSSWGVELCYYLNSCTDTSYTIREDTTLIGTEAFLQVKNLKEITLPKNIADIDGGNVGDHYADIFSDCKNLETINNYTNYDINLYDTTSSPDVKYGFILHSFIGEGSIYYAYNDEATNEFTTILKPNHTAKRIIFQAPSLSTVGDYCTINDVKYQLTKTKSFDIENINAINKYVNNLSTVGMLRPVALLSEDSKLTDCIKYDGYLYDVDLSDINNLEFGKTPAPTNTPTKAPTNAPTNAPTKAPTNAPTNAPTKAPTNAPTVVPTLKPTASPIVLPVVNLKVTQIKNRQIQLHWNTPKYKFIEIWRKEKHENKYTLLTDLYNSTFYIDHFDPLRKSNATYQYIVLTKTHFLDFELIDFSKFKSTNITTNWLMQPDFILKRNKSKKYISVKLQNYEGNYVVIEAKKNSQKKYVKIPLKNNRISKKSTVFTLRYKKHNTIFIRLRTYIKVKGKKKYSSYSVEKKIHV